MATISHAKLQIKHDHSKKLATAVVTGTVTFTSVEQALMRTLPGQRVFKLSCELWGADSWFRGGDDKRYRYPSVYYFADSTPTPAEERKFTVTVGEGVLDEDSGTDEIYGKLVLDNLLFPARVSKNTNEVSHSF
jgi:hypothetical protein